MFEWLQTLNLSSIDIDHYRNGSNSSTGNVDVAISGGGYRSLLIGAGVIQAIDGRENATNASLASPVSGFLQGVTYLSGLSGGAWLISSILGNNYTTVSTIQSALWEAEFEEGLQTNTAAPGFELQVTADITDKSLSFDTSINDPWGRLLSYQLLNGSDGGVALTLSGVTQLLDFANYTMPMPIIQALGLQPQDCVPGPNSTQYEFTPYEFGSWDRGVKAFAPMKYLGTNFTNSLVSNTSGCVTGFDNLGFVLATSSELFSAIDQCAPITGNGSLALVATLAAPLMESYMVETGSEGNQALIPNPFVNRSASPLVQTQDELRLVDGGLSTAAQNIPLWSLIQPGRNASLILAVDNSADSLAFPNGSEILNTYVQSLSAGLAFPVIPPVSTFMSRNLTQKPTLFGCGNTSVPTVVYLANAQHGAYAANQSTFKLQYAVNETDAMIANGFRGMTQDNDPAWARCLGCFVIYEGNRANATDALNGTMVSASASATSAPASMATGGAGSVNATGMSSECASCFDQYCYN